MVRLVKEQDGDVVQTYEYEFDNFSNRSELTATDDEDHTITYSYDANGNQVEKEV